MKDKVYSTVYLIVHELFGVVLGNTKIRLVTPTVKASSGPGGMRGHTYKIGRFKDGEWLSDVSMTQNQTYMLKGVVPRSACATAIPCHSKFSPHPRGTFPVVGKPYCDWKLTLPKKIHQLRSLSIAERPLFTKDPHGDSVEAEIAAVSLAQAFEYERDPDDKEDLEIVDRDGKPVDLDYEPDGFTNTVNLHLWAQIEDESGMSENDANMHAKHATELLVALFKHLQIQAERSVGIDGLYAQQLPMPRGIRFVELMTLGERFNIHHTRQKSNILCIGKTCGAAGNFYLRG